MYIGIEVYINDQLNSRISEAFFFHARHSFIHKYIDNKI